LLYRLVDRRGDVRDLARHLLLQPDGNDQMGLALRDGGHDLAGRAAGRVADPHTHRLAGIVQSVAAFDHHVVRPELLQSLVEREVRPMLAFDQNNFRHRLGLRDLFATFLWRHASEHEGPGRDLLAQQFFGHVGGGRALADDDHAVAKSVLHDRHPGHGPGDEPLALGHGQHRVSLHDRPIARGLNRGRPRALAADRDDACHR